MTRLPEIEVASAAAAWGVAHRRLLTVHDPIELAVERHVVGRAIEMRRDIEEAKATKVGNAVGRALGG